MSFWPNMEQSLQALMTSGIMGIFVAIGGAMGGAMAAYQISKLGLSVLLGTHGDNWLEPFFDLMIKIIAMFAMIGFWVTPIPGLGMTFPHVITGSMDYLVQQITGATIADMINGLTLWHSQMESPGWANVVGMIDYVVITILIWTMQAEGFIQIGWAMIATAVCIVCGPLFIGLWLFPGLDFGFRGWYRSMLQYSFQKVVVALIVMVVSHFGVSAMFAMPHASLEDVAANVGPIVIVLAMGIFAPMKAGELNNHIWSGSSGSTSGFLGALAARMVPGV